MEKVKQVIKNNYVHRVEAESVKGKIRENGKYRMLPLAVSAVKI